MTKYKCNLCFKDSDLFCEYSIPDEWDKNMGDIEDGSGDCPCWGASNWKKVKEQTS